MAPANHPVLYFDGVCNLCNRAVQYVIRHDKSRQFQFASLQSGAGKAITEHYKQQHGKLPDSLLLSYNGKLYARSDAALRTAIIIKKWTIPSKLALMLPRLIRDSVYSFIARNRYRWFGKKDECMLPTPELKSRFLS